MTRLSFSKNQFSKFSQRGSLEMGLAASFASRLFFEAVFVGVQRMVPSSKMESGGASSTYAGKRCFVDQTRKQGFVWGECRSYGWRNRLAKKGPLAQADCLIC